MNQNDDTLLKLLTVVSVMIARNGGRLELTEAEMEKHMRCIVHGELNGVVAVRGEGAEVVVREATEKDHRLALAELLRELSGLPPREAQEAPEEACGEPEPAGFTSETKRPSVGWASSCSAEPGRAQVPRGGHQACPTGTGLAQEALNAEIGSQQGGEMSHLESSIQIRACQRVECELGVLSVKLETPGHTGWPDRLFVMQSPPFTIEFKQAGEAPRPKQVYIHKMLRSMGWEVEVHDTVQGAVDAVRAALIRRGVKCHD